VAANGSFTIRIQAVDNASAAFKALNKRIAGLQAPFKRLHREMATFSKLSGLTKLGSGMASLGRTVKNVATSLLSVITPLGAITGAATLAGMYKLIEGWGDFSNKLGISSGLLGVNASKLKVMKDAAILGGSSGEAMEGTIKNLQDLQRQARLGLNPDVMRIFQAMHVDTSKSVMENLPKIIDAIKNFKGSPEARRALMQQLGIDPSMIRLIESGSEGLKKLTEAAQKYSGTTEASVKAGEAFYDAQNRLSLAVGGVKDTIVALLGPVLTPFLDRLTEWIANNKALIQTKVAEYVKRVGDWLATIDFDKVVADVQSFVQGVLDLVEACGGWKALLIEIVAIKIGAWVLGMVSAVLQLTAALGGLGGSGVLRGLLGRLALPVAGGIAAHEGTAAADPDDKMGSWIDAHIPGASFLDNAASKIGFGRSYDQQATMAQKGSAETAFGFFKSRGLSEAQSAGLVSNIEAESKFNSGAVGDSGNAYGIGQWHADRQANFGRMFGHDIHQSTFQEQLQFMIKEMREGQERQAGSRLAGSASAYDAGANVSRFYERPANADGEANARGQRAEYWLQALRDKQANQNQRNCSPRPGERVAGSFG
jgi:Phage tail lysozyme